MTLLESFVVLILASALLGAFAGAFWVVVSSF